VGGVVPGRHIPSAEHGAHGAKRAAKYEQVCTLQTHHNADDAAFNTALEMEDEEGNLGVALTQ
jgi:hypothetical protein